MNLNMRWMTRPDIDAVLKIENDCFFSETPWSSQNFEDTLKRPGIVGLVAEVRDSMTRHYTIAGYLVYKFSIPRAEILNFAVDREFWRQGIGTGIMKNLVHRTRKTLRKCIDLRVRESNLRGQLFFRSLGFKAIGVHREYYSDTQEDAYVMTLDLAKLWEETAREGAA